MLRTMYMSDYKFRFTPREKLISDLKGDANLGPKIKREFQFHEKGDQFYQDMEWKDLNLTVYQLDIGRAQPNMRFYPDGQREVAETTKPIIYSRKKAGQSRD